MLNISNKNNHKLNWFHLALALFCISWLNHGFANQLRIVDFKIFIAVFALWFMIACNGKQIQIDSTFICLLVYAVLLFVSSAFGPSLFNEHTYGAFYLVIINLFMLYYKQEGFVKERKVIWTFYLIEILALALFTTISCIQNPYVARLIAGGYEGEFLGSTLFIARFDNIYTFVLLIVFFIAIYKYNKHKLFLISTIAILFICLYFANFATAIFTVVVYVLMMFLLKKPSRILMTMIPCIFLIFIFKDIIANIISFVAFEFGVTDFLKNKLLNLADILMGNNQTSFNTLVTRLEYLQDSFLVFLKHPLIGIYGIDYYSNELLLIHGHNVWVDMFAYFGIIRSIPFMFFLVTWYKNNVHVFKRILNSPLAHVTIIWVILGFLNPVNKMSNQVFLFLLLPLSDVMTEENQYNTECVEAER